MKYNREQIEKAAEILEGAKVMVLNRDFDDFQNAIITALNTFALVKELIDENKRLQDLIEETQQYNEAWVEDNGRLRRDVKAIKADVVEVRHGERRFKEYGEDTYTNLTRVYECSLCGRTIECLNEADEPYCHCGAKMDG